VFDTLVDELYAPDYVLHDPGLPDFGTGPAAVKRFMHGIVENTPDFLIEDQDMIAEGEKIATRIAFHATNLSTGKPEVSEIICISHFSGGKIVEEWELSALIPVPA